MRFRRWLGLTGSLLGGFYVFMMLGVVLHEIVGHGLIAVWCGGRFEAFHINPGFGGWARIPGVPDHLYWIALWGGIAVNLLTGLVALLLLRWRGPHLSTANLALFVLALTGLGQGLGYMLQGFLFKKGDPAELAESLSAAMRIACIVVLALLLLWYAVWALRRVVLYVEEHYEPSGRLGRFAGMGLTAILPFGALLIFKPTTHVFAAEERRVFYSTLAAVVLVACVLLTWRRPAAADPQRARRPPGLAGLAWLLAAAAACGATVLWLEQVTVNLG